MDFQKLEEGYYWVKLSERGLRQQVIPSDRWSGEYTGEYANQWHIAQWCSGGWYFAGSEIEHTFDDLKMVSNKRLVQ